MNASQYCTQQRIIREGTVAAVIIIVIIRIIIILTLLQPTSNKINSQMGEQALREADDGRQFNLLSQEWRRR
jgi:hypothetical protein